MSANVGLVSRSTERDAHVLPTQRPRDRLGDRRLADSGRSDEEQDRPATDHRLVLRVPRPILLRVGLGRQLHVFGRLRRLVPRRILRGGLALELQLPDGQELQDAVLHVLETVVVLVQDLLGASQVDLLLCALLPRQLGDPLEEGADDLVLGRLRARALEPPELTIHLRRLLLGQLELLDALPHLLYVVSLLFLSELLLDRLQLLAQQHLALALTELGLDLGLDVFLSVHPRQLALDRNEHLAHAFLVVEQLEKSLLLGGLQLDVERNQIRERAGVVDALYELVQRLGRHSAAGPELGGTIPQLTVQRLEGGILGLSRLLALHLQDDRVQHRLTLAVVRKRLRPALALDEQLHAAADPVRLDDPHDGPDRVEVLGSRVIHVLLLRDREEATIPIQRLLNGLDRAGPPRGDRNRDPRIHDRVAQG